ncbi:hypothetical protein M3Y99_00508900 [Aphelenchoides fujianensis]|nr:hypothetical protein M3Y99_00508900 [Aphelenchoides fujianensis]
MAGPDVAPQAEQQAAQPAAPAGARRRARPRGLRELGAGTRRSVPLPPAAPAERPAAGGQRTGGRGGGRSESGRRRGQRPAGEQQRRERAEAPGVRRLQRHGGHRLPPSVSLVGHGDDLRGNGRHLQVDGRLAGLHDDQQRDQVPAPGRAEDQPRVVQQHPLPARRHHPPGGRPQRNGRARVGQQRPPAVPSHVERQRVRDPD